MDNADFNHPFNSGFAAGLSSAAPPNEYLGTRATYEQSRAGTIAVTSINATSTGTAETLWGLDHYGSLSAIGQPGIAVAYGRTSANASTGTNPFVAWGAGNLALEGDSSKLGWNYQSFGVWNRHDALYPDVSATSFGSVTPAAALPATGSATFTGKLSGLHVSPGGQGSIATADLSVNANFSTRSLSFASSGTMTTRDLATATAAPKLNLRGTLTYSPGSSTFTGALSNAAGTMSGSSKGRFYGPAAQELGGVFTVKSPTGVEMFTGAYGAKR